MYSHSWGLKAICHDALEPSAPVGAAPEAPGGAPGGPRAERSFAKNKKCCNIFQKDFLKSTVTQSINTENKRSNPSVSELFCSPFPPRITSSLKGPIAIDRILRFLSFEIRDSDFFDVGV